MRIAAFNVENLFDRPKAFNAGQPNNGVVGDCAELNDLFQNETYSAADKARILALLKKHGMERSDTGTFARIRKIRGQLISRPRRPKQPFIKAEGRADWVGWCELRTAAVDEQAVLHTAQVIRDVAADVLAVVEVESRPVLGKFHDLMLERLDLAEGYAHLMVIDGNDDRGIDVGLATRAGFPIGTIRSHVDARKPDGNRVFSRDCPEYEVTTPSGARLVLLPNHFKSKFGGNNQASRDKRTAQSVETAKYYNRLLADGVDNVVVLGDLNDTPDSDELKPLLRDTTLKDVSEHPAFTEFEFAANNGHRGIGTLGLGNDGDKIDYLLLSPALFDRVELAGIFRKGAWPGSRPPRWQVYDTLTEKLHAASDHHAIWADVDL